MSLTHLRDRRGQEGFTLIELLIVILIIGILAAIAIPTFTGQIAKARDSAAKSNVRNAVSAMESCFTDAQTYTSPSCTNATLSASGMPAPSAGTTTPAKGQVAITAQSSTGYTLLATSDSNNQFEIKNTGGTYTYRCTTAGSTIGGCAANNGTW